MYAADDTCTHNVRLDTYCNECASLTGGLYPRGGQEGIKPSNPKDALGVLKTPFSTVSGPVMAEVGVGMLEGAMKYGKHNYRVIGVRASVYIDATRRHLEVWHEGEDIDPDSGLSHITKAICSLVVLRDAMVQDKLVDDRPPKSPAGWMNALNDKVKDLIKKYPSPVEPYTEINKDKTRT